MSDTVEYNEIVCFKYEDDIFKTDQEVYSGKYVGCECKCGEIAEIPEDYTTQDMIWCDNCGARYVLCTICDDVEMSDEYNTAMKARHIDTDKLKQLGCGDLGDAFLSCKKFYKKTIANITGISTTQLYCYELPSNITQAEIRDYISKDEWKKDKPYLKLDNDEFDEVGHVKVYINVDCLDVEQSGVVGLDTSHDGVNVYLRTVCKKCGVHNDCSYCGD